MKKTLLTLGLAALALAASAQAGYSTKAVFDDFATSKEYSETTTDTKWDDETKAPVTGEFATKGILWGKKTSMAPSRGDGKVVYTITQAEGKYEPFVMLHGTYAMGTAKKFYTFDLSNDATLSFTVKNAGDSTIRLAIQVQDENDSTLAFITGAKQADSYNWQIGFVQGKSSNIPSGISKEFTFDLKTAVVGNGGDKTKVSPNGNAGFDFSKVKMVLFTVVNNNSTPDYAPKKLDAYPVEISNFKMGNTTTITAIEDNFLASTKDEVVSVYNIMGAFVATGKLADLNLEAGKLYVVKAGNKTRKIVMN